MSRATRPLLLFAVAGALIGALVGAPAFAQAGRSAQPLPASGKTSAPGVDTISETQLRAYLTFLADDAMEGRETPSRGLDLAANYLASLLTRWGLEPAGDAGSFFQTIALTRRVLDREHTSLTVAGRTLNIGDHYLPLTSGVGTAEGPLVYVGHGYAVASRQIDPYAAVDVRGKIVIMHPGLPPGLTRGQLEGPQGEDWNDGPGAAAARGALGILYLPDLRTLETWTSRLARAEDEGGFTVDALTSSRPALPIAFVSPAAYPALFAGETVSASEMHRRVAAGDAAEPFELAPGKRVTLRVAVTAQPATTRNVVAVWRGSDPTLRDEYVALGAHYDHLGLRTTGGEGDRVYNGADDDGSGTVALLAMAEALAHAPSRPLRSTLFVWHAGEEKGLWGSRYFTDHPTVPLEAIVTQLNVDMIGRSRPAGEDRPGNARLTGPDSVYVIGSRLMSTDLGTLVDAVNDRMPGLTYDYGYADPKDPNQFFYRSDHYHYAKHGIPVAFFFSGVHEDYHGVDDEVANIDFGKLQRVTQHIYATVWALGMRPSRPRVNAPLARELLTR